MATVILSGGLSKRMGSDKGLLILGDKPLILHIIEVVKNFSDEIIVAISRNSNILNYKKILPDDVYLVIDLLPKQSPVVGIYSGLSRVTTDYAFIVSCDTPFVNSKVVKFLFEEAIDFDAAIPRWPNGFIEPLHAVYRVVSTLKSAKEAYEANELRNLDIVKRLKRVKYIPIDKIREFDRELYTFFNINTPEDFERAIKIIESKKDKDKDK
ncbi:MAG: molybdenum cofactor guanylyltransferase [Nitrososphaerota archaeon]|nr:molybdenum cofactor guanylyltransferase [Nitrososphaerales archaeon]MDW8045376.1 molybdenum cofactor guanylyltransferase [Nitrososphaerota archaeon]